MKTIVNNINNWLIRYLSQTGDSQEIILVKKIWWLLNVGGLPFLLLGSFIIGNKEGIGVVITNIIWITCLVSSLFIFHFYKKRIEEFALITQIYMVVLSSVKVYILGGLLHAGGVIFIGLIAPLYALTLPNKKRAIFIYILYITLMIFVTLIQPDISINYLLYYYFLGFILGVTMAFIGLYYYSSQVEILKMNEKRRMRELDEFKTKFYTNITHEFRTPLTIILGMADQIKTNPKEWFNEGLKMIKRNGQNLLNLTNQMLELSKLEVKALSVRYIQNDITIYIKYLIESFHSLAGAKNILVIYSAEPEEIRMDFDPDKIRDIVSNLLSNAIKFTSENGIIEVVVSKEEKALKNYLILSVRDSGIGISSEYLPKVFDRYFQAEHHKEHLNEGSGLGLALTRELVKLLKGEITVESELGKGSTFIIRLPIINMANEENMFLPKEQVLSKKPYEKIEETEYYYGRMISEKLVLLIVEDNKDVVRYLHSLLHNDYKIEVATNGREGFEKAVKIVPDLVISDVMMPVMDGFTFCDKMKHNNLTSHIPVILLTARADEESKMEGLKVGADVYLLKPFNQKELYIHIKKLIELRKELQNRYKAFAAKQIIIESSPNNILHKEDSFMKEVVQTLELHISDDEFGIAELCRSLAISRSQLYRKFAALTDTTVHRFIRKLRLIKAKELLQNTKLNVSEVAYDTGFKNLSHFSRVYSEEFDIAPSKERE